MWKTAGYALLWLVGSAAAVGVAWTGVAVVDDDIVPAPALPQPADDRLESALARQQPDRSDGSRSRSTIGTIGPTESTSAEADGRPIASTEVGSSERTADTAPDRSSGAILTPGSVSTTTDTTTSAQPSTRPTSATAATSTSRSTTTTPGQTTRTTTTIGSTTRPTTAQPTTTAPTTSTTQATTAAPTTAAAQTETRTFHLVGGSTAISFSAAEVRVLWATPKPGFDVDVGSGGPGVRVEFEADDLESRIDVWWDDGPQHEIRER